MKYRVLLGLTCLVLAPFTHAADGACRQKAQDIEHEIELARQHNNARRVNGLERALTETRVGCTDEKLQSLHREKIREQQQKVETRRKELKEEKADGDDREKIAKREKKLAEAKRELKEVRAARY